MEFRELDLRPSKPVLQRVANAMRKSTKLRLLSSREKCQAMLRAVDMAGNVISSADSNGTSDWQRCGLRDTHCVCDNNKIDCVLEWQNMLWPAIIDLGLMISLLPKTLPMFTTLTTLKFNFYANLATDVATRLQEHNTSLIASFISRCTALQHLGLGAEGSSSICIVPAIEKVVIYLNKPNAHMPSLCELSIHHVDPTSQDMMSLLEVHAEQLVKLDFPTILPSPIDTYLDRWADLLDILSKATNLVSLQLCFFASEDINNRTLPQNHVLKVLLGARLVPYGGYQPKSERCFEETARALRGCRGDLRLLDLSVFYIHGVDDEDRLYMKGLQLSVDRAREAS